MGNIIAVDFKSKSLVFVERNGGIYYPLKQTADALEVDWPIERGRIRAEPMFDGAAIAMRAYVRGIPHETFCLRVDLMDAWFILLEDVDLERKRELHRTFQRVLRGGCR